MRYVPSALESLLKGIDRRAFQAIVARHDADAYVKSFDSWDHLVALIFAQLSGAASLRALVAAWNAGANHHYHLGCETLARSTLSDANERRPAALFADCFAGLAARLDRKTRNDGADMVGLIDSTPIPLGKLHDWAKSNGRIRGMKVHVLYDPAADHPQIIDITDANVNDAQIGRTIIVVPGATYAFDKGYCHYGWWAAIATAKAFFVTRPKTNMKLEVLHRRRLKSAVGEGCTILADEEVRLASKGDSKLDIALRRVTILRDDGKRMELITNDLARSAVEVAALYKGRWQIELLFRWIKQHLKIRSFLGRNANAVRLQILAAMIAFALLRLAARLYRVSLPILTFTRLVGRYLLDRRPLAAIDKPPPVNPSRPRPKTSPNQMSFTYAV